LLIVSHFSFVEQIVSFELCDEMDRRNDGDAEVAAVGEKRVVDHEAFARAAKHLDKPLAVFAGHNKLLDFGLALSLVSAKDPKAERDHLSLTSAQQTEGLTVPKAERDHIEKSTRLDDCFLDRPNICIGAMLSLEHFLYKKIFF
jgi:hypothetical protein